MKIKKGVKRSWYYFRIGYSTYLSLPIVLLGYASSIYYLAIQNIPLLKTIFPRFHTFIVIVLIILFPMEAFFGWFHFRHSPFFEAEQEIVAESNPFTTRKIPRVSIPIWNLYKAQVLQLGLYEEAEMIEEIIKRSV